LVLTLALLNVKSDDGRSLGFTESGLGLGIACCGLLTSLTESVEGMADYSGPKFVRFGYFCSASSQMASGRSVSLDGAVCLIVESHRDDSGTDMYLLIN